MFNRIGYMLQDDLKSDATKAVKEVAIFFGILLCALILWCIIYFIYNISTYTLKKSHGTKKHFGYDYSVYSSISPISLSCGVLLTYVIFSSWFGQYINVAITPTVVILCILSAGQFILNRIYLNT